MGYLVSQEFRANEVVFILRLIAYNVDVLFQQAAEEAAIAENRPLIRMRLKALKPRLFVLAGRLLRKQDQWLLRLPKSRKVSEVWAYYAPVAM